jgi:hypothetical protein
VLRLNLFIQVMQVKRQIPHSTHYVQFYTLQSFFFVGFPTIVLTHTEKNTAFLPQTHEIQRFHAINFPWHSWCKSRRKQYCV